MKLSIPWGKALRTVARWFANTDSEQAGRTTPPAAEHKAPPREPERPADPRDG